MCERKTPARAAARSVQICCVPTARGVGSVGAGFVNRHYRFSHSHPVTEPSVLPTSSFVDLFGYAISVDYIPAAR